MSQRPSFVVPAGVAWTEDTDEWERPRVFVAPMPSGPASVLPLESALIWLAAVEEPGEVAHVVAELTGHPVEVIRDDVEALLDQLVERGLLVRA